MSSYFFILGRNSFLSRAEILSVFEWIKKYRNKAIKWSIKQGSEDVLVVETNRALEMGWWMDRLGGTIKIGEILTEIPQDTHRLLEVVLEFIETDFLPKSQKKRINFGFSVYNCPMGLSVFQIGLEIKKKLRESGVKSRFVISKEKTLSSVVVKTNKLLGEAGIEFVLLYNGGNILIGRTLTVQEFEEYSFRDYGRPARDTKRGTMPPKLAKIMINLAQVPQGGVILDPFVGSGTILSEALLMGYKNLIGADIDKNALENTRRNLEWILKIPNPKPQIPNKFQNPNPKLLLSDVRNLSKVLHPKSIFAIVTEPYLGPPLTGRESEQKINKIINELENLYLAAFREFKKILKKSGHVVTIFPQIHLRNKVFKLNINKTIAQYGFKCSAALLGLPDLPLIYSRPDQKVIREIIVYGT